MAAPLLDPLVSKVHQTTTTLTRAAAILRSAFPVEQLGDKSLAVQLPRRDVPTYILPNQHAQPWELLPLKAAAMAEYPNFFNYSCVFFGSLKRDVLNGLPFCLVRPTRLTIDLAKVVRNLGIVDGFELVQRRDRLRPNDFVWTPDQPEPEDMYDVALFPHRRIRLHLRTDMFSMRPNPGSGSGSESRSGLESLTQVPLSAQLAPALGLLPFSTKNISKASQPVMMYPKQIEAARQRLPSGIFICYHHELGLITDVMAEQYDVPALVAAHVSLPVSHVAQIRGALRLKATEEAGKPLRHITKLKAWNMVELIRRLVADRQLALEASTTASPGAAGPESGGVSSLSAAKRELQEAAKSAQQQAREQLSAALDAAIEMEDGLLAWQLVRSGALVGIRGAGSGATGGGDGGVGPAPGSAPSFPVGVTADTGRQAVPEQRKHQQQRQQAGREQRPQKRWQQSRPEERH